MKLGRQWEERLRIWDEAFAPNLYHKLGAVPLSGFTTWDAYPLDQARTLPCSPFLEGTAWGRKWEYGWFHATVTIPPEGAGKRIVIHIGAGEEMLVFVNGKAAGSIDKAHAFVELTACGHAGECLDVWAEVYAGHGPRLEGGGICPREVVPDLEPPVFQQRVEESHFGIWKEAYFQAYVDYHTLYDLWKAMPERDLRTMEIGAALKQFTCIADFEAEEPEREASVRRAREVLLPLLQKKNGDTVPQYTVFGQSHLDLAWLWPFAETRRKSARTYANQLALMERYPDYRFLLCEPPLLEILKESYPELYERVKEKVQNGQMIPEGALYVESDTNLAGGESLVRQFVLGKRWFQEEFGVDSRLAWLPDTFGFCGALPQIMKGCEVPYFATQKLLRADPECEPFPYNNFWWEGIDGSRVLAHVFKRNNAVFTPGALRERWEQDRNQREEIDGLLFPFGYGDGGGGPTEMMVETALRCENLEGVPECRMESPTAFFDRLDPETVQNVYYGELYLRWHRGTYTALAKLKKGVRRAEAALREAEYLAGLLRLTSAEKREANNRGAGVEERCVLEKLDSLWKTLLFQEFHDILPGSSIQRVNEEAAEALARVEKESRNLARSLLEVLSEGPAFFNSLSWERPYKGTLLPPCGYRKRSIAADARTGAYDKAKGAPVRTRPVGLKEVLAFENAFYKGKVDSLGRIVSLIDKMTEYEYAAAPLNEWKLYQDVNVCYDAWELGSMYESIPVELTGTHQAVAETQADGSLTLTVKREEAYFSAVQRICFVKESPRIDFITEIDWHERHRILKADFPTSVYTREVLTEIPFGYIRRPTHKSTGHEKDLYEISHHRYAVLTDGENGFAVLNDCKYGLSARDSCLSLTLLRAPVLPDATADQGLHGFTYSILPFHGSFVESRVTEEAYEQNTAVTECAEPDAEVMWENGADESGAGEQESSMKRNAGADPLMEDGVSFFTVEGGHVILETCKPAFDVDNGVVLRLYESKGCAGMAVLTVPARVKHVYACNMLEKIAGELPLSKAHKVRLRFHSFEIQTLMLTI